MPIIRKPQEKPVQALGQIDPRAGARAAASGASIGFAAISAGKQQAASGLAMLREAENQMTQIDNAARTAQYADNLNKFKLGFATRSEERRNQQYDDNGNPTFNSLGSDIKKIGEEEKQKILNNVSDPKVRSALAKSFNTQITNSQISAMGETRRQKINYTRSTLYTGLKGLIDKSGKDDPANIAHYQAEIQKIVFSARDNGAINPDQADKLIKESSVQMRLGAIDRLMKENPNSALEFMKNQSPQSLGLDQKKYNSALEKASAAADDFERQQAMQKQEQDQLAKEQSNFTASQMKVGIQTGETSSETIIKARQEGAIDQTQFNQLMKDFGFSTEDKVFKSKVNIAISNAVQAGTGANGFRPNEIDRHYQQRLAFASSQGVQPSMAQKAAWVAGYKVPVKSFTRELETKALNDDTRHASDLMLSYDYLKKESPETLDGLDKKAVAVIAALKTNLRDTSLPEQEALRRARDLVRMADTDVGEQRIKEFNRTGVNTQIPEFHKDIKNTIRGMFDEDDAIVDDETALRMKKIFKDGYTFSGDKEKAIQYAKEVSNRIYGVSKFNEQDAFIGTKKVIMRWPPEKAYPGVSFKVLKKSFDGDMSPAIAKAKADGKIPESINTSNLKIQSDFRTHQAGVPKSWSVYYLDRFGKKVPLMVTNPKTGLSSAVRWYPDVEKGKRDLAIDKVIDAETDKRYQEQEKGKFFPSFNKDEIRKEVEQEIKAKVAAGEDVLPKQEDGVDPVNEASIEREINIRMNNKFDSGEYKYGNWSFRRQREDRAAVEKEVRAEFAERERLKAQPKAPLTPEQQEQQRVERQTPEQVFFEKTSPGLLKIDQQELGNIVNDKEAVSKVLKAKTEPLAKNELDKLEKSSINVAANVPAGGVKASTKTKGIVNVPAQDVQVADTKTTQAISKAFSGAFPKANSEIKSLVKSKDGLAILAKYGINNKARIRAFLAQVGHESAGMKAMVELRSDTSAERKYGYRTRVGKNLGNTRPGDGAKYKGRGLIQLTGRWNYRHYGKLLGIPLEKHPELASNPTVALHVAAAYWASKGLNKHADKGDMKTITKRINGGYNGLRDRLRRYSQLKKLGL